MELFGEGKMKILGLNTIGNDHSVFLIDTEKKSCFAISLERITRIKHDKKGVELIKEVYPREFENIDFLCLGSKGDRISINLAPVP